MFKILLLFFFLSSSSSVIGLTNDSLNVLFIGNSYTHMNDMPAMFSRIAKAKNKKVHVEKNTLSGASFRVHSQRADMYVAIKKRKWDYIVLQGYSREMSLPYGYIDTATMPFIIQIIDSIRLNHSCTNILLYSTWGYKDGFLEREEVNDYQKMTNKIFDGYFYLSEVLNLPIVPVGLVWKDFRAKYPLVNLYDADNAHPNKNGSYLTACSFYTAIFNETPFGAVTSSVTAENSASLQKTAYKLVSSRIKKCKLDMNTASVKTYMESNGKFFIDCTSNFQCSHSILWEFGDGKSSYKKEPIHRYHKPGVYKITLTVMDDCGPRILVYTVKFEAPIKPVKTTTKK